jgi:hypothetical protein
VNTNENDNSAVVAAELNSVKVVIAELRVEVKHLANSVQSLSYKLDNAPNIRDVAAVEVRLSKVEANLNKAAWAIIGAWVSGIGVVLTFLLRGS